MANTPLLHFYGVCERTHDGFWGEPLNALTSLAFFISGVMVLRYYRSRRDLNHPGLTSLRKWDIQALIALIFVISASSFIFHTLPSQYTEMADVASVVLFINLYFITALFWVARCHWFQAIVGYIAFLGFSHIVVSRFPQAMNDSIGYLTTMASLVMIALYLNLKRRAEARSFMLAALLGVVALFFRSIDNAVCAEIPIGSHFLWHGINAVLVFVLMRQIILAANRQARMQINSHDHYVI